MISIIVPVYNLEKYIEKSIQSLVFQTYSDLEILLLDDGSCDNSLEICKKWERKDPRIKVFHHENQGVSATRNYGLSVMRGDYVCFVDGDDWLELDCLEKMMEKMTDGIDMVCCDFIVEKEDECKHEIFYHKSKTGEIYQDECVKDYFDTLLYTQTIWGKVYRKKVWDNIHFKKLKYSEDSLAMFEVLKKISKSYFLKEEFYHYLQRKTGASHCLNEQYYQDILYTLKYNFETAAKQYPEYLSRAGAQYIDIAYNLLKIYEARGKKEDAINLISNMKEIYREAQIESPSRAQKLLVLPNSIVYWLILLKRRLKGSQ